MIRRFLPAVFLALGLGGVLAQNLDVIKERQNTMKSAGQATGVGVKMLRGEQPFDLAKVQASLQTFIAVAKKMPTLFPDDSKTGGGTNALPTIWDDKPAFTAGYDRLGEDAAAAQTAIKDEASFKAEFPKVLKDCGDCHQKYRAKMS